MSSKKIKSLEEWINYLDSKGQLIRNDREVETRNEISAISKKIAQTQGSAVLHTNISGYPGWRIFHDGFLTRERIGWGFDVDPDNINNELIEKLKISNP